MSDFMKIPPVRAEVFHEDRQTVMAKLTVANAPKSYYSMGFLLTRWKQCVLEDANLYHTTQRHNQAGNVLHDGKVVRFSYLIL
jgi:hypothetical protein